MSLHVRPIRAITRKELLELRRNKSVVVTMAIFPLIFLIQPLVVVLQAPQSSSVGLGQMHLLLYMLAIPVLVPATVAAHAVVAARFQESLEPVLTTPVGSDEFLIGKALAALVPSVVIAYAVYAVFLLCAALFAQPAVASAILQVPDILAQLLFTPLLAVWSIWVGMAISTRSSDLRTAQQLSLLGSVPAVLVTSLIAFDVVHATLGLAVGLAATLLVADVVGWRIVSPMLDRERLITGSH